MVRITLSHVYDPGYDCCIFGYWDEFDSYYDNYHNHRQNLQLTLEERRKIEGVSPERADIIISGALILQMILREDGIPAVEDSRKPGSMP